jgi:hypothetical protein
MLRHPITLEQPIYLPGDERQGVWASSLLETVYGPEAKWERGVAPSREGRLSLRGDLELVVFAAGELRRAYADLRVSDDTRVRRTVPGDDRRPGTPPHAIDDHFPHSVRQGEETSGRGDDQARSHRMKKRTAFSFPECAPPD